ncbi:regulating synaptic membrane exocytosis protein 2 isoform X1 [Dendroctonus ponderosae]|uniref:regulating synaptic membrane exocytosis protein 2 isoform X1 n=1 Tax=Dendroctonus ponderosae TaxID=77166 RepID=UPI002034C9E4|nr:regulating synaptic membrane exocytosis protein 2 isoform X1 [Dendroctonus ponderosae]
MEEGPDLSHLTPEERTIIESVMVRQKQEEEREQEIMRKKADEVQSLEQQIRARNEQQKKAGVELEATCHICLKTKFADGIGHICNYCTIRCCARCGGKVTLRSGKSVWVCILCRKKQELLGRTGQWMQGGMQAVISDPESAMLASVIQSDKRPKLERAHSAAEKENQPLQRSGSVLRRQYSEEQSRTPSCDRYKQYNEEDPMFYQGELEGLMRAHPHLLPRIYPDQNPANQPDVRQERLQGQASATKKHKRQTKHHHQTAPPPQLQLHSYSSSEEDLKSTPEYSSDRDSEKGVDEPEEWPPLSHYIVAPPHRPLQDVTADNRGLSDRRKKTVRFDHQDGRQGSQGSQDSHRDSGIDTSSTFTSSEDSTRGDFPKHPHQWQVSSDGSKMLGHMILRRGNTEASGSSAAILGLKVVGGKLLENGAKGAIIEKVKKGSIADVDGQLRPGDEVIEWNGRLLQSKSYQEVADIIAESKQEVNVELIVSRPMGNRRIAKASWRQFAAQRGQPNVSWPDSEIYERPHVLVTSPGSPDRHEAPVLGQGPTSVGGRVQIRLGFDTATLQLFVTIVCATGLRPRSEQQARNPYCKLFLLPDRSEKSKRRTRTLGGTTEPMWNQTFVYSGLRRADLRLRSLEITVWDYVRYGANDFLGEANVELWPLDEQPTWRQLVPHEEVALTPSEHLSPPSTGSRFSDSDTTSECEIEGSRERRGADGASVSSVGSSSSPPRECERRSRRDQESIAPYKYKRDSMTGARSHSAAPCDTQVVHSSRSRSKSPRRMATDYRSLSPPDCETVVVSGTRFKSRSATATPTGSPKKRQLPQVPHALARALQERVAQDLEDRGANNRRVRYVHHSYRNSGSSWERRYSGLSDSDLTSHVRSSSHRRNVSPDRDRDPLGLGDFDSDMESVASVTSSSFSTQSERPRGTRMSSAEYSNYSSGGYQMTRNSTASDRGSDRDTMDSLDSHHHSHPDDQNHHHHHHHHHHRREGTVKRGQFTRSLSNTEPPSEDKADGSLSDTAVSQLHGLDVPHRERKDGRDRDRQNQFSGLNKKSSSTSQLSATGRKRRMGFGRRGKTSFTVHRSEEVLPGDVRLSKQGSSASSDGEGSADGDRWSPSLRLTGEGQLAEFIEGLGPGQLVGRQVLGAPSLGDIQLSLCHQRGVLEVEIIRARGLQARTGSKVLPAPYVKVYLVCGKKCYAKAKTQQARRTLDPLYQKQVTFKENYTNCILQVTVWGDYGRIEGKKVFMGVAQIMLDDLNLSNIVIGWYKLFGTTSLR